MHTLKAFLFALTIAIYSITANVHAQFIDTNENTDTGTNAEQPINLANLGFGQPEITEETLVLRGQISAFEFVQPETRIWFESEGNSWELIAPSAVELRRLGWTSNSVFSGEFVEVEITRLLGTGTSANLKRLTRSNGALLFTRSSNINTKAGFSEVPGGMYRLDSDQAHLVFSFDHMGFSKTSVKIERLSGTVLWNAQEPQASIIQIDMDISSLRSGNADLDEALRGPSFFDSLSYPKISFNSTGLNLSKWGELLVAGQLNIFNLNQPVDLNAQVNQVGLNPLTQEMTVGLSVSGSLDRSQWGLNEYADVIPNGISLNFEGEFILTTPADDMSANLNGFRSLSPSLSAAPSQP